jgi:hypothetical protein
VKDAKTSARSLDALSSELWDVKAVTVNDGSRDVATLLLVEEGTALRVIAKLDVQGRNWVLLRQVMQALAMRNIGAGCFVSKSKRVARWVRLLHVSMLLVRSLKHPKRWEMSVLSR